MASKPVDDDDLILCILGGLGPEYGPFVTSITTRGTYTCLLDLHRLLLNEEIPVNGLQQDTQNIAANVATKSSSLLVASLMLEDEAVVVRVDMVVDNQINVLMTTLGNPATNKTTCKVCIRMGHTAIQCYQRFNYAFVPNNVNPNAQYVAQSYSSDLWYPDSGATYHITPDLANLFVHTEYAGNDAVNVGNGTSLPIHHIGHSIFRTQSPLYIFMMFCMFL